MNNFYTESPLWHEKIGGIHALLERVKISEEQSGDVLRLRKLNRIMSIHASTAIEGNRLTLTQVTDVINGIPVWGPQKDIKEVQNAWQAYNELTRFDPWGVDDLLKAHALMTNELIGESGAFRTVDVAVVRSDGAVMHRGAAPARVPHLVEELLDWGRGSKAHPLIKSSAVHFMLEHIHPFRDGNGRIGRLWQTLVLSKWNPLFAWMPIETLVHYNQTLYYKALQMSALQMPALQDSHKNDVDSLREPTLRGSLGALKKGMYPESNHLMRTTYPAACLPRAAGSLVVDCQPFIDFMLDAIENSLYKYVDIASSTEVLPETVADVGVNVGVNVGVKFDIIKKLKEQPAFTAQELAAILNRSPRTIERHIKELRECGVLVRVGSDKSGYWQVNEGRQLL